MALFMAWMMEAEIFSSIVDGNIAYEMCRPVHIYSMWFARSVANRVSKALLRCAPILVVALIFAKAISIDTSTGSNDAFLIFTDNDTWNTSNSCNWRDYLYQLLFYHFCPRHSYFLRISM